MRRDAAVMDSEATVLVETAEDLLTLAFPFHLVVDRELRVIGWGPSIALLIPALSASAPLSAFAQIERPKGVGDFRSLIARQSSQLLLRLHGSGVRLRGQVVELAGGRAAFLASPWITELDAFDALGLTLGDFALHDPATELVILLQSRMMALEDAQRLAVNLEAQRASLDELSRAQHLQLRAAEVLSHRHDADGVPIDILRLCCEDVGFEFAEVWFAAAAPEARWEAFEGASRLSAADVRGLLDTVAEVGGCFVGELSGVHVAVFPLWAGASLSGVMVLGAARPVPFRRAVFEGLAQISNRVGWFLERVAAQRALHAARERAEAASRAKSAFLAAMSHELRTPLNAVIGTGAILYDSNLTEDQRQLLDVMRSNGDSLLALISDILDLAKVESGKMELDPVDTDIRVLGEDVLDVIAPRAAEKRLRVALIVEPEVPEVVRIDPLRLRQVLVNLLGNAVKFTQVGEVVVTVRALGIDRLEFRVSDTGPGIPADRLDRLFRPFSQVDAATARRHGGTGLGLAISREIVALLGGVAWCQSESGQGSTFGFDVVAPPVTPPPAAAPPDGPRVLVVCEHRPTARALRYALGDVGARVEVVADAAAGLEASARGPFLCVIAEGPSTAALAGVGAVARLVGLDAARDVDEPGARLLMPVRRSALRALLGGARAVEAPSAAPARDFRELRVLIVDDNAVNRMVLRRMLEKVGVCPDEADDGTTALEAMCARAYDLVLMDVQMPQMDGTEASRRMRARRDLAQPRITAVTANAIEGDREVCLAAGMDDFVSKPVRPESLRAALERAVAASLAPT